MVTKAFPTDLINQAKGNLESWKKISTTLVFGDLTQAALSADLAQADVIDTRIKALDAELTDLRNQRDALHLVIWDKLKRLRSSIKGLFGDDSSEYEMMGGTRKSERKRPTRKTPPPAA